jgi:DNA primase
MALSNVHLTPQLIQAVRDAVDIVALASEHTRLKKSGRRYLGLCPLHKEKTPSFSVDPVQGLFYCFGCGAGGDTIKLHMLTTGDDFPAAIETLATRHGIPLPTRAPRRGERGTQLDLTPALQAAAEYFVQQLEASEESRAYLAERRVPMEVVQRFGLGYAPPAWRDLLEALRHRIPVEELLAAGLVARSERRGEEVYDRFRHRLMFPIRNAAGRLVGFGGRTLGDDRAKYINTSETPAFHKGYLLYGLDQAKKILREGRKALLVEGYFDVLAAAASDIDWSVASMGTALTPEQAHLLARYADEAVVGYDCDSAGEAAYRRALPLLLAEGLTVSRARFGEDQDPDSLRLQEGPEAVATSVHEAGDAVVLEIDRLVPAGTDAQPRLQARAAAQLSDVLRSIPDPVLRYGYAQKAADRLRVPVEVLWRRIGPDKQAATRPEQVASEAPRLVHSLEDRILHLLLAWEEQPKPPDQLPPAEIFFDPVCRNIYQVFCALYTEERAPPEARQVRDRMGAGEGAVDRIAQILLQESTPSEGPGLSECLERLERRWQQQRLKELAREIDQAQKRGDKSRLDDLLSEKTDLSCALHVRARNRRATRDGG